MNYYFTKTLLTNALRIGRTKNVSFLGTLSGAHVPHGSSEQAKSRETKVLQQLKARIQQTGPIPVADYMKEVLSNPMSGFYMHRDILGTGSEIIASEKISRIFGELVAEWGLNEWRKAGRPKPFYIVELGPNRGELADDLCRVFSQSSDAKEVVSLHLVEVSPHLSQLQELKLCGTVSVVKDVLEVTDSRRHLHLYSQSGPSPDDLTYKQNITKHGVPVSWYRSVNDLPKGFAFYVSYELFDVYPIHKFKRTPEGWKEVLIDINEGPGEHHLHYVLSRGPTPASRFFIDPQDPRDEVEVSPESGILMQDFASRLNTSGGVSLIIDYGHEGDKTDTFRAFRKHSLIDPLCEPGTADLTADVDFAYLKKMVKDKSLVYGPITQEQFLKKMNIEKKIEKLMKSEPSSEHDNISKGYQTLVDPSGLGGSYKFLALYPLDMLSTLTKHPPLAFK